MPGRAAATVDAASLRAGRAVGAHGAPGDAADDPVAQRARRKADLAACLRIFGALGFSHGAIGHVTARDPVDPSLFWVNPYRRAFRTLEAHDLLLVDAAGGVVEGTGSLNPPAYLIHSRIHAARPDVVAAAHVHSPSTVAWSAVGRPLGPITQDSCVFFERQALFPTFGGVVDSAAEAERVAASLQDKPFLILANHGVLVAAPSVRAACWWFVNMDRACRVQLAAEAVQGGPTLVDADTARRTGALSLDEGFADECFSALVDEWT